MIQTTENLVEQLLDIYYTKEEWHINKLDLGQARDYFNALINKGNIICIEVEGKVLGYVEFWCVSLGQLQRIKENEPFFILEENITYGSFCYIHNIWVDKDYRNNGVLKQLKETLFDMVKHCFYIAGVRKDKKDEMRLKEIRHGKR